MAHYFITGGSGFIGQRLCARILAQGDQVTVLSRQAATKVEPLCGVGTRVITNLDQLTTIQPPDYVINLAGEPILKGRWSNARKSILRRSRIDLTRRLIEVLAQLDAQPRAMISGSAIGYYGDAGENVCTEHSPAGHDFAATLCRDWELAARTTHLPQTRLAVVRIGVVLDPAGGSLQQMLTPFRLGLGGKIGNGKQWFSWITRDDLCRLILFLLGQDHCQGVFNGTAPEPVRNAEFTQLLAHALHRPARLPVPATAMKLILGEAASLLLASQRVTPAAALEAGFSFEHPTLKDALQAML